MCAFLQTADVGSAVLMGDPAVVKAALFACMARFAEDEALQLQ